MEPDYIAQKGARLNRDAAAEWFAARNIEAMAAGCTHGRYTIHPAYGWLLLEGWKVPPRRNGELSEGEPRWQIVASE